MNAELENIEVTKNEAQNQYEMEFDGYKGLVQYKETDGVYAITHTEVAPELEGKGVGSALVEKTLAKIESDGKKILPYCPFVSAYIKKHPDWKRLVDERFEGMGAL